MKRLPRWSWLLIAVGVLLILGTILLQIITPTANSTTLPRGTTLSAAPKGSLALSQWLEAEGYTIERVRQFPLMGDGLDVLFVITPEAKEITEDDAADITRFVERGGTLFYVTDGRDDTSNLRSALDLVIAHGKASSGATATPSGPTLGRPPVGTITLQSDALVRPVMQADPRFLTRATSENGTVVMTIARGKGRVHVIAGQYPLSNAGIKDADNLALVQNLLAGLPARARIGFDEYHHGYGLGTNIADLALRSPWGWALFYLAGLTLVAFVLGGRRFGRPLPAPLVPPKAPAEYARALGNLWREGKQRGFAQAHIAETLKHSLAVPFGLDPTADDGAFIASLAARRPDLATEYATIVTALRTPTPHDADFAALIQRADDLRRRATEPQAVIRAA